MASSAIHYKSWLIVGVVGLAGAAFNQDKEFFAFYRSLQAYREGLNGKDTSFVLSPEGNFFRFFGGWAGEGAAGGTASGSAPRATR